MDRMIHRWFARYVFWRTGFTHWRSGSVYTRDPACPLCRVKRWLT